MTRRKPHVFDSEIVGSYTIVFPLVQVKPGGIVCRKAVVHYVRICCSAEGLFSCQRILTQTGTFSQ